MKLQSWFGTSVYSQISRFRVKNRLRVRMELRLGLGITIKARARARDRVSRQLGVSF